MSQLGSFDGYSRRLLNPALTGLPASRAAAPQRNSQDNEEASSDNERCVACKRNASCSKAVCCRPSSCACRCAKQLFAWMVLQGCAVCQGRWTIDEAATAQAASSAAAVCHASATAFNSPSADCKPAGADTVPRISHCDNSPARARV